MHAAALTSQRPDAAVGRASPGSAAGGRTSTGRAWTTRCGSTARRADDWSSTRPTAGRVGRHARCASARSGRPTARTSPRWPRRASSGRRRLTALGRRPAGLAPAGRRPSSSAGSCGLRRRARRAPAPASPAHALLLGAEPLLLRALAPRRPRRSRRPASRGPPAAASTPARRAPGSWPGRRRHAQDRPTARRSCGSGTPRRRR